MPITNNKTKAKTLESFERQTKMSWAILLTCMKDVPLDFQPFFEPLHVDETNFPYALITPSYEGFIHRSQAQLVCLMHDAVYLANKGETVSQALCVKFQEIQQIQFGTVLLDSNMQIRGIDSHGQPAQISLRFNTVSDGLFKKIINAIRQTWVNDTVTKGEYAFDKLEAANLKLSNFARHSILSGESVRQLIWQPELRRSKIKLHIPLLANSILYQTVFPNHVTMLTDKELILIRETERMVHDDRYGGVWDYVPLDKIKSASILQKQDGLLALVVELFDGHNLETHYLPSLRTELEVMAKILSQM